MREIEKDLNQIDPDAIELPDWDKYAKRTMNLKRKTRVSEEIDEYTPPDWDGDNSEAKTTDIFSLEPGISVMWPGPTKHILDTKEKRFSVLWPRPTNNILIPKSE